MNPSNEDLLPDDEGRPIIAFHEYPGGPPITFQDRSVNDDLEPEAIEQRPYVPGWSITQHPLMPGHIMIGSRRANVLMSRELAVAARRQLYLRYRQLGIELAWHSKIPQRKALLAGHENEWPSPKLTQESFPEVAAGKSEEEVRKLRDKIKFLEAQLQSQKPYLQLYRLGAGSLFISIISIVVWLITGTGIPFHPIFAGGVIPVSLGVIAMAFLARSGKQTTKE